MPTPYGADVTRLIGGSPRRVDGAFGNCIDPLPICESCEHDRVREPVGDALGELEATCGFLPEDEQVVDGGEAIQGAPHLVS